MTFVPHPPPPPQGRFTPTSRTPAVDSSHLALASVRNPPGAGGGGGTYHIHTVSLTLSIATHTRTSRSRLAPGPLASPPPGGQAWGI